MTKALICAGSAAAAAMVALAALAPAAQAAGLSAALSYVSNQEGAISVIDLDRLEVVSTLDPEARGPRGIGVTADGAWVVTANLNDGNVSVIEAASGKLLRQVAIGRNPEYLRVSGKTAFVTFEPSAQPGGGAPAGAGAKSEEERVPGHIAIVDLEAGRIVRDIVGKPETEGLEFSRDGTQMIVTNESDNSLAVYEIASGRLLRTVSVAANGERPRGIKRSPDGSTYLVTLERSDKLLVFNERLELVREVATGRAPYGVAFDRSGEHAYVAAAREKALQVFDARTWAKVKDVPTGERCWHFSFTPDERRILVACGRSNEIVVIDAARLEAIKHIGGLKTPWGIVTFPRAPGSIDG